jgi:hypothetical protein
MSKTSEVVNVIVHETLAHIDNPIVSRSAEVLIPLILDPQIGRRIVDLVATQLRAQLHGPRETVWVSKDGLTLIHKQVRVAVMSHAVRDPVALQDQTLLMAVIADNMNASAYGTDVLAQTLNNGLTDARYAYYQGYVLILDEDDGEE